MPRISVVGQGSLKSSGKPTLRKLDTGETFRFPNSASGKVYQKVGVSERAEDDCAIGHDYEYVYSDLLTGQLFGDWNDQEVVPVACSMSVSEKK